MAKQNNYNVNSSSKSTDKGKWFVTPGGKEAIHCTMDRLADLLTIIFKGDRERGERTAKEFHPAYKPIRSRFNEKGLSREEILMKN